MSNIAKEMLELSVTAAAAFSIAFVINLFGGIVVVDGVSMEGTLRHRDILIRASYHGLKPQRGDVIAFKSNLTLNSKLMKILQKKKALVKRVIGIEGDNISITDGKVYRNGALLVEQYINNAATLPNLNITVPEDMLFVMGDNREYSLDSRSSEIGLVSIDRVLGKITLRLFPINNFGRIYK